MATCLFVWDKICDYAFLGAFRTTKPFVWGWILFAALRLWLVALAYLPLQIEVAFEAGSPSACLGQYAHATTLHAERYIACWFTIVYNGTRHGNVLCIGDGFRKWLYHTMLLPCSYVLFWITDFLKPLFFLCKGSVMLRQMESVLCGRFAVTNKIADNLPFSPHRQQKTSIIVDFHGAVLMCHIPAFELHVKIKFHFKK